MSAQLFAVVVARSETQRGADKLADRFAARHDRTYCASCRPRGNFDRRPYAVYLFTTVADIALGSLESYDVVDGRWFKHATACDAAEEE